MNLLNVAALTAEIAGRTVLDKISMEVKTGEVHALMGPNGGGKSSLANVLLGNKQYEVKEGSLKLNGEDLLVIPPDERARKGIYVAWQTPMTIPGLSVFSLCKAAYEATGNTITSIVEFRDRVENLLLKVGLSKEYLGRGLNEGFSGGEKKRLELLQLLLLEPKLAILDEIDSGLDIDALRLVGEVVVEMKKKGTAFILITHYKRLLDYVEPNYVHILKKGKIVESGGKELIERIERGGYGEWEN